MAQTIAELREQADRDAALNELRKQRAEVAARLERLDGKIQALSEADFTERLASVPLSEMTLRERSETAQRLGVEEFERLVVSGRR